MTTTPRPRRPSRVSPRRRVHDKQRARRKHPSLVRRALHRMRERTRAASRDTKEAARTGDGIPELEEPHPQTSSPPTAQESDEWEPVIADGRLVQLYHLATAWLHRWWASTSS